MSSSKSILNKYTKDAQRGNTVYNKGRLFRHFALMAKNRFRWENLPAGMDSNKIEQYLFEHGVAGFFMDEIKGLLCLPISNTGELNVYGEPLSYTANGVGYSKTLKSDLVCKIKSNDDCLPNILQVAYYSDLIDEIEMTMYANLRQQKKPYIITTTKQNEFTMKNLYNKIDNGEDAIFIDERLSQGGSVGINILETKSPYLLDKLQLVKNDTMNELLTFLGLNNTNNDKKERLIVSEVNVNNNHILMNLDIEYKNRQKACEQINAMFGLNISVIKSIDEIEVDFIGNL